MKDFFGILALLSCTLIKAYYSDSIDNISQISIMEQSFEFENLINNSRLNENLSMNSLNSSLSESYFVEKYAFPFIILVGTISNSLTFLVMRRKKMRHQSTYFYMAVLAIADEMVLLVGCLTFWIYVSTKHSLILRSIFWCKTICMLLYATSHFSVWIVVIMTIERFIAVALPLQAHSLCTVKRAKLATTILAVIVLCINGHFLFTHTLFDGKNNFF